MKHKITFGRFGADPGQAGKRNFFKYLEKMGETKLAV